MSWYNDSVFYHIYPLGLCGCEKNNSDIKKSINRISTIEKWIPHFKKIGINALYMGPVLKSSCHGYDTIDYKLIDERLGSNADFKELCTSFHKSGIKIILEGVFNHVGRDFWAFKDVKQNRQNSKYKDWFYINFNGNSNDNDGFYYEGWEGHYDLVKLNLSNNDLVNYLFSCIEYWISYFDIDGLRLDVAYSLDKDFLKRLSSFCRKMKKDFFLLGEMIHGDYNTIANKDMLNSVTNYECYKGIYSSLNSKNMFEIQYSLNRQFAKGGLYENIPLYSFVENHDVTRIASILTNKEHIKHAYALLLTMPGIPAIYYGGEWALEGKKENGDYNLRPSINIDEQRSSDITKFISLLTDIRTHSKALCYGDYNKEYLTNNQLAFSRNYEDEKIINVLNIEEKEHLFKLQIAGNFKDLISGNKIYINNELPVKPYDIMILKKFD